MNYPAPTPPLLGSSSDSDGCGCRIGAVSYLNTKPLIDTLPPLLSPGDSLSLDLPSRLADQLADEEIDVGLIPAVEFFRGPASQSTEPGRSRYRIVSNACIACLGPVRSVRLFFRVPPQQVRNMAADEGSRTSIALAQILLADRFDVTPSLVPLPISAAPDQSPADAVLVIGDRAMHPDRFDPFIENWDLGNEWYRDTKLPFVFAMWVGRDSRLHDLVRIAQHLELARDQGVESIDRLSRRYAASYGLSHESCVEYLSRHLRFTMGREEWSGLKEFHRRAVARKLVADSTIDWLPISSPSAIPQPADLIGKL